MRPNEIIGVGFTALALAGCVLTLTTMKMMYIIPMFIGSLGQAIFLSWWGIDTFNGLFKKK